MARTDFGPDWQEWVRLNVARGCSKDELFRILAGEGFDHGVIQRELAAKSAIDIPGLQRLRSPNIELYTAQGFLEPAECEELVELIKRDLRSSEISTAD